MEFRFTKQYIIDLRNIWDKYKFDIDWQYDKLERDIIRELKKEADRDKVNGEYTLESIENWLKINIDELESNIKSRHNDVNAMYQKGLDLIKEISDFIFSEEDDNNWQYLFNFSTGKVEKTVHQDNNVKIAISSIITPVSTIEGPDINITFTPPKLKFEYLNGNIVETVSLN